MERDERKVEIHEKVVQARLHIARVLAITGFDKEANKHFKQALSHLEILVREKSRISGVVLLNLIDFYRRFPQPDENNKLGLSLRHAALTYLQTDEWGQVLAKDLAEL